MVGMESVSASLRQVTFPLMRDANFPMKIQRTASQRFLPFVAEGDVIAKLRARQPVGKQLCKFDTTDIELDIKSLSRKEAIERLSSIDSKGFIRDNATGQLRIGSSILDSFAPHF